jgi:hypothetical protein
MLTRRSKTCVWFTNADRLCEALLWVVSCSVLCFTLLPSLCHATCLSEVQKHECNLLMLRLFIWSLTMYFIMFSLYSVILLSCLCHATCLSEVEKHEWYLLMLRLFMCSLTMCCSMFSLCSLTSLSIFMSCYMLIGSLETCVWFTNVETIYVKPYNKLYHMFSPL